MRWIHDYIGTAAWHNVAHEKDITILDVRNLVDKGGNDTTEVRLKIEEGLSMLAITGKILVCCDYGMSRSNSIAAGIISKKENIDFEDAVNLVIDKTGEKEIKIGMLDSVQAALGGLQNNARQQQRILVTGANGFIGKYLKQIVAKKYNEADYIFLSSNDIDLESDVVRLNTLCKKEGVSTIIHLASPRIYTTSISFGQTIVMLKNVLDVCVQNNIKLLYTSSWEVFSGYKTTNLFVNETMKLNPGGTYGQSKMLCENLISYYTEELGLRSVVLRISPVYGLGADKPKSIWNFIEKALANKEIKTHLYLNGLPMIELLHIEDAAEAIAKATNFAGIGIFNISPSTSITTKNLAELIVELTGSASKVTHTQLDLITHNITLDNSKAKKVLDWSPSVLLRKGLENLLDKI